MIKISLNEAVDGEKFSELLNFIVKRSDTISVARYYSDFLDVSEFAQMQESYKKYIYTEDAERRDSYKRNLDGYKFSLNRMLKLDAEHDAYAYFDEILEQELNGFGEVNYGSISENPDTRFTTNSEEFIKTIYTRATPVTQNPIFEMCFFKIGKISASITDNMKGLYDYPYIIEGVSFEDITFYNNDNIVLAVCSHEESAYLNLNENDLGAFNKLGITYE